MTKDYILKACLRTKQDKNLNTLRQQGQVPAVVYGHNFPNQSLIVDYLQTEKAYQEMGESNLLDLVVNEDDKPIKVVIKDIMRDPVSGKIIHADFYRVKMDEKMTAEVPLKFIGESRAVKDLGGILVKNFDGLETECLPGDLISSLEVDLSQLKELGDLIRVSDLEISDKIKILAEPDDALVVVEEPKKQEEQPSQKTEEEESDAPGDEKTSQVSKEEKKPDTEAPDPGKE